MNNLLTHRLTSEYVLYDAGLFLHVYMQARFLAHACISLVSRPKCYEAAYRLHHSGNAIHPQLRNFGSGYETMHAYSA